MKKVTKKIWNLVGIAVLIFSMLLSGCGTNSAGTQLQGEVTPDGGTNSAGTQLQGEVTPDDSTKGYVERAYAGEFKGKKVTIMGSIGDSDLAAFEASVKEFKENTGIDLQYENTKEFEASITIRVDGGNPPDIANFASLGLLSNFAEAGNLVDLKSFLSEDYLKGQYKDSYIDMTTMDSPNGEIMAAAMNRVAVASLVWYPKSAFDEAGYKIPETWDELIQLSEDIVADGGSPWSIAIESGAATGWPAAGWVADMVLRVTSPENYDKWVAGELSFTSPEIKKAFEKMSEIWKNEDYVYGGSKSIVSTNYGDAVQPLFTNPPKAWLHKQANFMIPFFPSDAVAGEDYDFFQLPSIDPEYGIPVVIKGDMYAMFNDRPEVRAVMEYFTTADSIKQWIMMGGTIAPMNGAEDSWYTTDVLQRVAKVLKNADTIRYDASDAMPATVGAGTFWKGIVDYFSDTLDLDAALEEMQSGWNNVED
ncbi:ABC transporter substrate-binding protein [Youxingia wuxianensis]|uniref:Carbohydrate ABC transporter substrate-binding protein n=1 Tax=Youxingia wuxianensis TaxID=2763678 RepID=A0A926ID25_9FIRM|nr:ABC transporter substrate-binding protein [Youxingia wuxianensis]MBC8585822.1 carbohydrate ABC transporter substrate-binding protein [Youxingia wuxianensis]